MPVMIRSLISIAVISSLYGQWARAADRLGIGLPPQWIIPQSIPAPPPGTEGVVATALLVDH